MVTDRTMTAIALGLIAVIAASELIWVDYTSPSAPPMVACKVHIIDTWLERDRYGRVSGFISFEIQYLESLLSRIRVVALPLPGPFLRSDGIVHVFFDGRYPYRGLGLREWIGLKDHLPIELRKLGFEARIVDADQLAEVMRRGQGTVVIPSGVIPDTVYSTDERLMPKWLAGGGVLVWIGYAFGFYIGHRDGTLELVGTDGQVGLLGYDLQLGNMSYWDPVTPDWTEFAKALGLSYLHAWMAPPLNVLEMQGGLALGGIYKSPEGLEYSSISLLPLVHGWGKVVLFGGGVGYAGAVLGEDVISRDIAKILWSGLPYLPIMKLGIRSSRLGPTVCYKSYLVNASASIRDTLIIDNLGATRAEKQQYLEIALIVFSLSPHVEFYVRTMRATSHSASASLRSIRIMKGKVR